MKFSGGRGAFRRGNHSLMFEITTYYDNYYVVGVHNTQVLCYVTLPDDMAFALE